MKNCIAAANPQVKQAAFSSESRKRSERRLVADELDSRVTVLVSDTTRQGIQQALDKRVLVQNGIAIYQRNFNYIGIVSPSSPSNHNSSGSLLLSSADDATAESMVTDNDEGVQEYATSNVETDADSNRKFDNGQPVLALYPSEEGDKHHYYHATIRCSSGVGT